jgi:hypothetical protein
MVAFIIRLVGYAALLGAVARIAATLWSHYGLDNVATLQPLHDDGITVLVLAPIALALIGIGPLRGLAVFAGFFLAGAALTAPFVCARIAGM